MDEYEKLNTNNNTYNKNKTNKINNTYQRLDKIEDLVKSSLETDISNNPEILFKLPFVSNYNFQLNTFLVHQILSEVFIKEDKKKNIGKIVEKNGNKYEINRNKNDVINKFSSYINIKKVDEQIKKDFSRNFKFKINGVMIESYEELQKSFKDIEETVGLEMLIRLKLICGQQIFVFFMNITMGSKLSAKDMENSNTIYEIKYKHNSLKCKVHRNFFIHRTHNESGEPYKYLEKNIIRVIYNFDFIKNKVNIKFNLESPYTKLPITINVTNKTNSDFLIVSFNEGAKSYNSDDCIPLLQKINNENPSFIVISTQESSSKSLKNSKTIGNARHYQHVFGEELEKFNFPYKRLLKVDASVVASSLLSSTSVVSAPSLLIMKDKNVRTRIYYNTEHVDYNEQKKSLFSFGKKNEIYSHTNKNKYFIKSFESKKSESSGFGEISPGTLYKGSIFIRLEIKKDNIIYKIIFVNSHLYYKKNNNTGLTQRQLQFLDLVEEFKLVEHFKNGYNIFFCGDLNFRLYTPSNFYSSKNIKQYPNIINDISKNIIKKYSTNLSLYKKNSSEILQKNDELYKFLKLAKFITENKLLNNKPKIKNELYSSSLIEPSNEKNRQNKIMFYQKLIQSIETLGTHITAKYLENKGSNNSSFYFETEQIKKKINTKVEEVKNIYQSIESEKTNKYPYISLLYENKFKLIDNFDYIQKYILYQIIFEILILQPNNETNVVKIKDKILKLKNNNIIGIELNERLITMIEKKIKKMDLENSDLNKLFNKSILKLNNSSSYPKGTEKNNDYFSNQFIKNEERKRKLYIESFKQSKNSFNMEKIAKNNNNNLFTLLSEKVKELIYEEIERRQNEIDNELNGINKKINNSVKGNKEIFDIRPTKNQYPRIPSQTDRILYALAEKSNILISPANFDVYLIPDKSDHKMVSLSFELDKDKINGSNGENKVARKVGINGSNGENNNNNKAKNIQRISIRKNNTPIQRISTGTSVYEQNALNNVENNDPKQRITIETSSNENLIQKNNKKTSNKSTEEKNEIKRITIWKNNNKKLNNTLPKKGTVSRLRNFFTKKP